MPRYSFVIPVYNCEQYLEECVNSVLAQTVSDFEILLIDDGSTDSSGAICDSFKTRDERIVVFHKENGGAASARNYGIDRASGKYVLFIDCDDTIEPNCLESIDAVLIDEKCILAFGMSFDYWRGDRLVKTELYSAAFPGYHSTDEIAENLYEFFEDNVLSSACNKVFPAKLLNEQHIRFSESMRLYEDLEFVLRCLQFIDHVQVIGQGLYHYRNMVEKTHLDHRVTDLDNMRENLAPLNKAFKALGEYTGQERNCATISANLYIMLLEQHLLSVRSNAASMQEKLPNYISEEGFRDSIRSGAELEPEKQKLVSMIDKGRFPAIKRMYMAKRLKRAARKMAKRVLGR